jgi:hypothetical protein
MMWLCQKQPAGMHAGRHSPTLGTRCNSFATLSDKPADDPHAIQMSSHSC